MALNADTSSMMSFLGLSVRSIRPDTVLKAFRSVSGNGPINILSVVANLDGLG